MAWMHRLWPLVATSRQRVHQMTSKRGYKNFVMNETLAQLEQYCAEIKCKPDRDPPPQKVTVIGAGSDVGRVISLCLKSDSLVKVLAMYDDKLEHRVLGAATDIAHIDTSTCVEAYQGRKFLKEALRDAHVVVICGGSHLMPVCCNQSDQQIFDKNLQHVRTATMAAACFAPGALVVLQTPPVDANFAVCKYTLKRFGSYDKRKLLGVNAITAMRAAQLFGSSVKIPAEQARVPIICGTCRCTRVPVFSSHTYFYCAKPKEYDHILSLLRDADEMICRLKCNNEQAHLSIGYSTAKFVSQCMQGLFVKPTDTYSALVEQEDPERCFGMKYCSMPVTIGPTGIIKYHIPKLSEPELELLQDSKSELESMIKRGECAAKGDEYVERSCKECIEASPPPCPVCKPA